ncbi:MAG: CHRD domain-containing protein [Pseudanabaena sp. ELA645]|jgi:hypothetical protein
MDTIVGSAFSFKKIRSKIHTPFPNFDFKVKTMIERLKRYQNSWFGIVLSILSCLFIIGTAAPSQAVNDQFAVNQVSITEYQQQAESELIAQNGDSLSKPMKFKRFAAILSGDEIFPNAVPTQASGTLGAVLVDNRLIVRGDFRGLSSPLRDYVADPSPQTNPKVTSAVHIHRGSAQQNGPTVFSLEVIPESNGLNGRVKGNYILTDDQLKDLNSGLLYIDIHTKGFRPGELRGILKA